MKRSIKFIGISCLILFLTACATTPTWKGMSESDIAAWQQLGVDAATAQKFMKAGLTAKEVEGWHTAGIKSPETILAWHAKSFTSGEAAAWNQQKFSIDQAVSWKKQKFTADEAGKWKAAGFDLDDAVKNREKGLQPIK